MPTIAAIFPVSLPSTGGVVYIYGDYFSKLYDNATMKLNGKWQYNCNILFSDRLKCDITKMPTRKKNNYSISVVFENTVVRSVLNLNFYGINKISPSKGPVQKSTKIIINGFGYIGANIVALCKIADYTVAAEIVNSDQLRCNSSVALLKRKEQYNHYVPFAIKISTLLEENANKTVNEGYDTNELWTKGNYFFFYVAANATKMEPSTIQINEIYEIYVYSASVWSFKNTLVGDTDYPTEVINSYFATQIYCKFGDFGKTKATYISENIIKCPTPAIKTNLALIYEVEKTLSLTYNGKTFIENKGINIKFIGVLSPLVYTWVLVGVVVGTSFMIGFVVFITKYYKKAGKINKN